MMIVHFYCDVTHLSVRRNKVNKFKSPTAEVK
jgi:hypothetical protein